jgi:hypothetical protein
MGRLSVARCCALIYGSENEAARQNGRASQRWDIGGGVFWSSLFVEAPKISAVGSSLQRVAGSRDETDNKLSYNRYVESVVA